MSITVSLEKLHQSSAALDDLSRLEDIPITLGFLFAKAINATNAELAAFESARKLKLEEVCKKDEHGNVAIAKDAKGNPTGKVDFLDKESEAKFAKEIDEMFKVEVELSINQISQAKIETQLKDTKGIKPAILAQLSWLFFV